MSMPGAVEMDTVVDTVVDAVLARLGGRLPSEVLPDLAPPGRLGIAGVELTQSTQHAGAAGPSYGPDNSVPLVALKPLAVRAFPYVTAAAPWAQEPAGQRVDGELVLSVGDRIVYRTGPTRADGVRVGRQSALDRMSWDQEIWLPVSRPGEVALRPVVVNTPLNFLVPAWYCRRGRVHVSVRVWRAASGPADSGSAVATQYAEFLDVRAPRLCLVRVAWSDADGDTFRPTDRQMLDTTSLAERMLPFPWFETTILGIEQASSGPIAMVAPSGGCNASWNTLLAELEKIQFLTRLFGLGDMVFGMVPTNALPAPPARINSGCGLSTGACFVTFESTFAHEVGHLFGRAHVAVRDDPANDPGYPRYGGSSTSIGEVGIDLGSSPPELHDPSTTGDIMSYESQQWISPYTYRAILEARESRTSVAADPGRVRPLLYLDLRVHREGRIELVRALRVEAPGAVPARDGSSPLSIDLLDRDGHVLLTHHCRYATPRGGGHCGCGGSAVPQDREPYLDLHEALEWPEGVAALSFHRGQEPLDTVEVGQAPTVSIQGPERVGDDLVVHVEAEHPRSAPSIVVLFSGDDGLTWQPVGFDPPDGRLAVEAARLPGGARCRFRAVATAELQPAVADTEAFALPRAPRALHIVTPPEDCGIAPGPVPLRVLVDSRGLGAVAPQDVRWHSSIDGDLGVGHRLVAHLGDGTHELTVTAPDGLGGVLSERAIIIVSGRPSGRR